MQFLGIWHDRLKQFSGVRGPNFTKLGQDIEWSALHKNFVSAFGYLAAFSNASGSNLSDSENDAKSRTFWPPPRESYGRGGRDLYTHCWSFTYDRTSGIHLMAIHSLCGCWAREIDKKRQKRKFTLELWRPIWHLPAARGPRFPFCLAVVAAECIGWRSFAHG